MDTITLIVAALVTARLTRLVTLDRITEAPRTWILSKLDLAGLLAYLITCTWCASFYVGLAVAGAGAWAGAWTVNWIVPLGLAFSYVAGWLASQEGE